jgi:glucose/arabinose dehydrogenase
VLLHATLSAVTSAQSVEKLWDANCAKCHGDNGQGGGAGTKTFLARDLFDQKHDRPFFDIIKNGSAEAGMDPYGETLSDEEIWGLVVHIRELQERAFRADDRKNKKPSTTLAVSDIVSSGLETPWAIDWLPDGTMLITERPGTLRAFRDGKLSPPISDTPKTAETGQGGLMDIAVHPAGEWIYLAYNHTLDDGRNMTRFVRGKIRDNTWTDEQRIWEAKPEDYVRSGLHFGSRIVFRKAADQDRHHVFFSIGDRGENPRRNADQSAQLLSKPHGKVFRLWDDGSVPDDNPFVNTPDAYPAIWSFGHRNPQGLVFDFAGNFWDTEHGPRGGDELNRIEKGRNYGWPIVAFSINYNDAPFKTPWPESATKRDPDVLSKNIAMPVFRWLPSIGACGLDTIRPGVRGEAFQDWKGDLIAGGLSGQNVDRLRIRETTTGVFELAEREELLHGVGRVRDCVCGPDGAIYVVLNQPDKIIRLSPKP